MKAEIIDELFNEIQHLETYQYVILGIAVLILLILLIRSIVRSIKRSQAKKIAPKFKIEQILVAPLGMGVQVKIKNSGHPVTIINTKILDRTNVEITQAFENYLLETNKTYLVFCEATDRRRADSGFKMAIKYKNKANKYFKQEFFILPNQPKLLKLKFA